MKNAIFMLMFGNPVYMVGGCISASIHKKFIKKLGLDIDVNVMVDENIYKYNEDLLDFFDNVYKINLDFAKMSDRPIKDFHEERYSSWIGMTINKWQVLNYEQYDKVLLVDIDFIPINDKFYSVFTYETPSVLLDKKGKTEGGLVDYHFFDEKNQLKNKYIENSSNVDWPSAISKLTGSVNASLVLLKPQRGLYQEYLNFLKLCEGMDGINDMHVDEKTLVLFTQFYKNMNLYNIPYWFAAYFLYAPHKKDYYAINYPIKIKPWVKPKFLQKKEETLWPIIAEKCLPINKKVYAMYNDYITDHVLNFFDNYYVYLKQYYNKNAKWFDADYFLYDRAVMDNKKFRENLSIIASYVKYCIDKDNKKDINIVMKLINFMAKEINHKIEFNVVDLIRSLEYA